MIFTDIFQLLWTRDAGRERWHLSAGSSHAGTILPSVPMRVLIISISCAYAKRGPAEGPEGGRLPRLAVACRRRARLHPVGRVPADRVARVGSRHGPAGAPSARREPDGGRADARG